jgi:ribose transport system ATP-binding protein
VFDELREAGSEFATAKNFPPRLSFSALSKTFGATRALKKVSLEVWPGEIHGLVGQNGSGKSTLIKVLAGFYEPDAGSRLSIDGAPVRLPLRPGDYSQFGISFVHQDLALIPSLTVLENLRVSELCLKPRWYISWKEEIRAAQALLTEFALDLDPLIKIEEVDIGSRALLAILRAMDGMRKGSAAFRTDQDPEGERKATEKIYLPQRHRERGVQKLRNSGELTSLGASELNDSPAPNGIKEGKGLLVLDEPTPFLARRDVERLFSLARRIKAQGASVLFVSHDLDEVLTLTDRVTVIRDGAVVGTFNSKEVTKSDLIEQIIGHPLLVESGDASGKQNLQNAAPAVKVTGLSGEYVDGIGFELREGEILGMSGLLGSGFTDVPYLLFGAKQAAAGTLRIREKSFSLTDLNPSEAVKNGIALIPVDRRGDGVVEGLSLVENISLPVLNHFGPWCLQHSSLRNTVEALVREFDIRPGDAENRVGNLSGGNQQKVLLAKWLQTKPKMILLDEPTQGVDVGAREQIYQILKRQAATGTMIICASSDYEELATLCSRVLIFSHGRIVEELVGNQLTKEAIAQRCHLG